MNTATEINLEGDSDRNENSLDRRRGMKLVMTSSPGRTPGRFKIGVSSDIFSGPAGDIARSHGASQSKIARHDDKLRRKDPDRGESESHTKVFAVGAFLLAGLVGYLIGRGRR